jgi:hypothetical protein
MQIFAPDRKISRDGNTGIQSLQKKACDAKD